MQTSSALHLPPLPPVNCSPGCYQPDMYKDNYNINHFNQNQNQCQPLHPSAGMPFPSQLTPLCAATPQPFPIESPVTPFASTPYPSCCVPMPPFQQHACSTVCLDAMCCNVPESQFAIHLQPMDQICDPLNTVGIYAPILRPHPLIPILQTLHLPPMPTLPELPLPKMSMFGHTNCAAQSTSSYVSMPTAQSSSSSYISMTTPTAPHLKSPSAPSTVSTISTTQISVSAMITKTSNDGVKMKKKKDSAAEKKFACPKCGKRFKNKSGLSNHKVIHNGLKPHKCRFAGCGKAFARSCDLTRHTRLHTGDKPFVCKYKGCGKSFTRSVQLRLHVMDHTGLRPFRCEICKKGFKTLQNAQIHRRTHTGEKPYQCQICKKRFTQSSSLRTHMSSLH